MAAFAPVRRIELTSREPAAPWSISSFEGAVYAHGWKVSVMKDGAPANLTGYTAEAEFYRGEEGTIVKPGTISGNLVTVYFPAEAYAPIEQCKAVLWLTDTVVGVRIPIDSAVMHVAAADNSIVIDPGSYIPSLPDLVGAMETMATATAAANAAAAAATAATAEIAGYAADIADILAFIADLNGDDTAY